MKRVFPDLERAINNNNLKKLKNLIAKDPKLTSYALLYAVGGVNKYDIIEFLVLHKKTNINARRSCVYEHIALTIRNNPMIHEILLKHKDIDVNLATKQGMTTLMFCSRYSEECVELLLRHGKVNINQHNNYGNTAIYEAATHYYPRNSRTIKLLIKHGANCQDWKNWTNVTRATRELLSSWRFFLPKPWSIFNHKIYPQEFNKIALNCLLVFKRIEKNIGIVIGRDMKRMLIRYIAINWRNKVDELKY